MTSSNRSISTLLSLLAGIHRSPVNSPHKGQWHRALIFYFDLRLNKRLSKQSWGWWFETPSRSSLQWRHNGRDGVPNYQPHNCLLNRLFRRRWNKTSKLRVTGLCAWYSPVTTEFPVQRASNAENVSIWWRHHMPDSNLIVFHKIYVAYYRMQLRQMAQNSMHFHCCPIIGNIFPHWRWCWKMSSCKKCIHEESLCFI